MNFLKCDQFTFVTFGLVPSLNGDQNRARIKFENTI